MRLRVHATYDWGLKWIRSWCFGGLWGQQGSPHRPKAGAASEQTSSDGRQQRRIATISQIPPLEILVCNERGLAGDRVGGNSRQDCRLPLSEAAKSGLVRPPLTDCLRRRRRVLSRYCVALRRLASAGVCWRLLFLASSILVDR